MLSNVTVRLQCTEYETPISIARRPIIPNKNGLHATSNLLIRNMVGINGTRKTNIAFGKLISRNTCAANHNLPAVKIKNPRKTSKGPENNTDDQGQCECYTEQGGGMQGSTLGFFRTVRFTGLAQYAERWDIGLRTTGTAFHRTSIASPDMERLPADTRYGVSHVFLLGELCNCVAGAAP